MKVPQLKNQCVYFTHRPIFGMSLGFYPKGSNLVVAAALANDGTNHKGEKMRRRDQFSRKEARKHIIKRLAIMDHRLEKSKFADFASSAPDLTWCFEINRQVTDDDIKNLMGTFRDLWKPDPSECDPTADPLRDSVNTEERDRSAAWTVTLELIQDTITNCVK